MTTIHVIAQANDRVVGLGINCDQDRAEGVGAAVDIANGDGARHLYDGGELSQPSVQMNRLCRLCGLASMLELYYGAAEQSIR